VTFKELEDLNDLISKVKNWQEDVRTLLKKDDK